MTEIAVTIEASELVSALAATLPHVSTAREVPILNGVHFTMLDDVPVLAATDRFTLAVRRLPSGTITRDEDIWSDPSFTMSTADAKRILRLATDLARSSFRGESGCALPVTLTIDLDSYNVRVDANVAGQVTITALNDGAFPRVANLIRGTVNNVLADKNRGSDAMLNPRYLARFEKAAEKGEAIVIRHSGEHRAVLITAPEFVGAIMPAKAPDGIELDAWIPRGESQS